METSNSYNQILDLSLLAARFQLYRIPILIICDCLMIGNKFATTIPSSFLNINGVSVVGTIMTDINQFENRGYCYFTTLFCGMLARCANMEKNFNRLTSTMFGNQLDIVLNSLCSDDIPLSLQDKLIHHEKTVKGKQCHIVL